MVDPLIGIKIVIGRAFGAAFLCPDNSRRLLANLDHQSEAEIDVPRDRLDQPPRP